FMKSALSVSWPSPPFSTFISVIGRDWQQSAVFVTTWLGVFLLLLLQAIGNHFSPSLALIIPACLLIVSAYTAIRMNPFGYLMLIRISATNAWHPILVLLGVSTLATMGYLAVEHHASLN
ncbi:Rhodopsin-like GPCR superfamily protein, partial [Lacticaseibacillus rhamnosus MTCC 5462]